MTGKIVVVRGDGLSEAILATLLALKGVQVRLQLSEPTFLVQSWRSVSLGPINVDNGYHAIDVFRAPVLSHLLQIDLGLNLLGDSRPTGIFAFGNLFDPKSSHRNWPFRVFGIGNDFDFGRPLNYDQIEECICPHYLKTLMKISSRYSDDWQEARSLIFPWMLPADVRLKSLDEGDIYRNLLRSGEVESAVLRPRKTFEEVGQQWLAKLLSFSNFSLETSPDKGRVFSQVAPDRLRYFRLSIFGGDFGDWGRYSEVLVAEPAAPEISRISAHPSSDPVFLLVESYHRSETEMIEVRNWAEVLSSGSGDLEWIDDKVSRTLSPSYLPVNQDAVIEIKGDSMFVVFPRVGPINMAKAELRALNTMIRILEEV